MKLDPNWLTSDVIGLARRIRCDVEPELYPVLADALMDAGCGDAKILGPLQSVPPANQWGMAVKRRDILDAILHAALVARCAGRLLTCSWLTYDQHGAYGSGGWSRHAAHRPLPRLESVTTADVIFKGKSVYVNGQRKLKLNIADAATGEVLRHEVELRA